MLLICGTLRWKAKPVNSLPLENTTGGLWKSTVSRIFQFQTYEVRIYHMPTPLEQIKLLVSQLNERGVDSRWLKQVFPSLSQNYENPDCWTEIAASLRQKGNYGASELVYKTALEILNESAKLWNNYGILLQKWDKLKEALSAFDRAIQLYPLYASAITSKGRVLEQLHKFAEARSYYLAALELDPTSALLTNNIGSCFFGEWETEKAEIWF